MKTATSPPADMSQIRQNFRAPLPNASGLC
jgi:hypothetical protein